MADDGKVELQGEVIEAFRGGMYRIALDNDHETLGYVSGKMRRYRIRINPGDRVTVELSPVRPHARPDHRTGSAEPRPTATARVGSSP